MDTLTPTGKIAESQLFSLAHCKMRETEHPVFDKHKLMNKV